MKKGGGIGPLKPWQPLLTVEKGAKSYSQDCEKDKLMTI